jgi:hypothetical protein
VRVSRPRICFAQDRQHPTQSDESLSASN